MSQRVKELKSQSFFELGFSLPEALITLSVVGVIGLVLANLVTGAYRGNTKTELVGDVKQNGEVALSVLDKTIRNSEAVVCTGGSPYQVIAIQTKQEGRFVRFFIKPPSQGVNGYIARQEFTEVINPNSQDLCDFSQFTEISPSPDILTDNSSKTAVSVKNGRFSVSKNPGFKDTVTVQFEIGPGAGSGSSFDTLLGGPANSVSFKTSVQLR